MMPSIRLGLFLVVAVTGKVRADDLARPAPETLPTGIYRVESFGARADGKTDCHEAITRAIAAAQKNKGADQNGGGILEFGAGVYLTSKTIVLPHSDSRVRLAGLGRDMTVIRASAPMQAVIEWGTDSDMSGISVEGARLSDSALRCTRAALSKFSGCAFRQANFDGILLVNQFNDGLVFEDCISEYNGRLFRSARMPAISGQPSMIQPGTVAVTAGSAVVKGVGTKFKEIPVRPGDPIRVGNQGASDFLGMVQSIDSDTQLTLQVLWLPTASAAGQEYLIGIGCGYSEEHAADNNYNRIRGGLYRCNAGHGLLIDGLYGDTLDTVQIDGNGFAGICVGRADANSNPIGTVVIHPYLEGNPVSWWLSAGIGLTIIQPNKGTREIAKVFPTARALGQLLDHEGVHPLFPSGGASTLVATNLAPGLAGPSGPRGAVVPARVRLEKQATIPRGKTSVVVEHGLGGRPNPEDVGVVVSGAARVWLGGVDDRTLTFRTDRAAPNPGIPFTYSASRQP